MSYEDIIDSSKILDFNFDSASKEACSPASGNIRKLEVRGTPVTWRKNEGFLVLIRDTTEKKELEYQMLGDELKCMLMTSISHELRTPLNCITLYLTTSNNCTTLIG